MSDSTDRLKAVLLEDDDEADDAGGATVFDVDGTWTRDPQLQVILPHAAKFSEAARAVLDRLEPAYRAYKDRDGSFRAWMDHAVKLFYSPEFFSGISPEQMRKLASYIVSESGRRVHVFTRELAEASREVGMHRAIISGSPAEVIREFAAANGIRIFLGTEMEIRDGVYTGQIQKAWVEDKREAVCLLAQRHRFDLRRSVAIGDTTSDVGMFSVVQYPICFNPNVGLLTIARGNRWPIVMEKKDVWLFYRPDDDGLLHEVGLADILPEPLASVLAKRLSDLRAPSRR